MNEIMLSVRPKWCELIAKGQKTIEIRKTKPNCDVPFKVYIYCTKPSKKYLTVCGCMILNSDELFRLPTGEIKRGSSVEMMMYDNYTTDNFLNGKVIGEFTCDRIYELETQSPGGSYYVKGEDRSTTNDVARQSCLFLKDMHEYLRSKGGYGWHISYLKIYDEPKQLSEFRNFCAYRNNDGTCQFEKGECDCVNFNFNTDYSVTCAECLDFMSRPPRSWCYVERRA